jgi:DNA-binding response OmpR family regulator
MDGLQLAHLVRDRWPPVKILVTSGHHSVRPGDLPAGGLFIQKPYTSRAVTEAINALSLPVRRISPASVQADVRRIGPNQVSSVRFRASRALRAIAESAAQLR